MLKFADPNTSKNLSLLLKEGKLRRIHHGIYADNLTDPIEKIVLKHWMLIVSYIVPHGILSHRTALELKALPFKKNIHIVFITSSYWKTISLPGLIIKVSKGNYKDYCEQVLPQLARSNMARSLLENLSVVRNKDLLNIKTIGANGVEKCLAKELHLRHEKGLNQIRDQAKIIAKKLKMNHEYEKLNKIISALLSSQPLDHLKTPYGKALAKREPFDQNRLQLFEDLSIYLKQCLFVDRKFTYHSKAFKNLSFFESYFSNYIEGTEFIIDEAEDIVFSGKEIENRHEDSHDILSCFYIVSDYLEITKTPKDKQDLLEILKLRHAFLMKERPDKRPGEFKKKPNKAGNTYFVEPKDVIGTLTQAFDIYQTLKEGMERAIFMQFLISEVHPFDDGNGRMARIMMNAELANVGQYKIIVPTVHRDNYLNGLRRLTRDHYFQTYCKVMDQAQAYTQTIDWADYGAAREKIEKDHAEQSPDEGLPTFNRVLRKLIFSDLPV